MALSSVDDIKKCINAIACGEDYAVKEFGETMCLIVTNNPDFKPDDGSDPKLVIQMQVKKAATGYFG
jgi:hypothetical protein